MQYNELKKIIIDIKCDKASNLTITQDEIDQIKACVSAVQPIEGSYDDVDIIELNNYECIPNAINDLQDIIKDQQKSMLIAIKQGIVKAKVNEVRDNISFVNTYVSTTYSFLTQLINIIKEDNKLVKEAIKNYPNLSNSDSEVTNELQNAFNALSIQVIPNYSNNGTDRAPAKVATFDIRLINLDKVTIELNNPNTNKLEKNIIPIYGSNYLKEDIFRNHRYLQFINIEAYNKEKNRPLPKEYSDYDSLIGLLYNGIPNNSYKGLYRKLNKPLSFLFTLEDRGLTLDSNLIDPILKEINDAPTSLKEDDQIFYIKDQAKFESFYSKLDLEYLERKDNEINVVFPNKIKPYIDNIKFMAKREVATLVRGSLLGQSYNIDGLTKIQDHYKKVSKYISNLIKKYDKELELLEDRIIENSLDGDALKDKVSDLECFSSAVNTIPITEPDCEALAMKSLGIDPLYLHTILQANGDFPDITTQCYWREFTNALNKISLLPFPDLSGPPPANTLFRYWPINSILPGGPALVLLTLPPVWKPLFVLPTAVGTLIGFIVKPIAPIGIPIPSIYLMYLAPDGTKYMALACNFPKLYANPKNLIFGFELDTTQSSNNPLGLNLTNSYKGYPIKGAYLQNMATSGAIAKSTRLTELAATLASGKLPIAVNLGGGELPFDLTALEYESGYLSTDEIALNILESNPAKEFSNTLSELQKTINRQINKLGDMQTTAIDSLRQRVRNERELAIEQAQQETDLEKKRLNKKKGRKLNSININEKIESTKDSYNKFFDNITFGTIRYPKDATKNNPGLSEAVSSLIDILTLKSLGDTKIDDNITNLNYQINRALSKIDISKSLNKIVFNVNDDLDKIKESLKDVGANIIKYLKGNTTNYNIENDATAIKAAKERQETIRSALIFTSIALANSPTITIFDLNKSCCEVDAIDIFPNESPEVSLAFNLFAAILYSRIDKLTANDIKTMIGTNRENIGQSFVESIFNNLILAIPKVTLPKPADLFNLVNSKLLPVLAMLSIPKALNPLHPPSLSIVIPLDPILKPLIKALIGNLIISLFELLDQAHTAIANNQNANSNSQKADSQAQSTNSSSYNIDEDSEIMRQIFTASCGYGNELTLALDENRAYVDHEGNIKYHKNKFNISLKLADGQIVHLPTKTIITLDIIENFHLITPNDIIELVRSLINSVFDIIIAPLKLVVDIISRISRSLNTYTYNIIEAAIPQLSTLKIMKMSIDANIPQSLKFRIISESALNIIQLSLIPALRATEPILKEVAWLATLILCSTSSAINKFSPISIARMVHPIMNADDLPIWERLTHKNPLFAIFLDELAWRGSLYSTGSLIFQSKTPAVLPYTPTFPIIDISPHSF